MSVTNTFGKFKEVLAAAKWYYAVRAVRCSENKPTLGKYIVTIIVYLQIVKIL